MSDPGTSSDWLAAQLARIPLAQAMQISVAAAGPDAVRLRAPLAPNINDKDCAFGGSIGSLLMLTGWGLLSLQMQAAGVVCGIYIQDHALQFLKPGWATLETVALADPLARERLPLQFRQRGRGRATVQAELHSDGVCCARMQARYVALPS